MCVPFSQMRTWHSQSRISESTRFGAPNRVGAVSRSSAHGIFPESLDFPPDSIVFPNNTTGLESSTMRRFPNREAEVAALASEIIFGLRENVDDFPSPPVSVEELQAFLDAYTRAHEDHVVAQGAAAEATSAKGEALEDLADAMKGVLRYAEHAVGSDDSKLRKIGWRGRREPSALQPPGAPRTLEVKREGRGWVYLDWKSPADGGAVSAYRVNTRTAGQTEWKEAVLCFESMSVLTDQPEGVEIEYQVIALNKAGDSLPSNLVTAVL